MFLWLLFQEHQAGTELSRTCKQAHVWWSLRCLGPSPCVLCPPPTRPHQNSKQKGNKGARLKHNLWIDASYLFLFFSSSTNIPLNTYVFLNLFNDTISSVNIMTSIQRNSSYLNKTATFGTTNPHELFPYHLLLLKTNIADIASLNNQRTN
jgi:hypothetical protein